MERVQKYDRKGEKIKVLAPSNQKLQMRGISKKRRHSRRAVPEKTDFDFVCQNFCSVELFDQKCQVFDYFPGGIKNDANSSPR